MKFSAILQDSDVEEIILMTKGKKKKKKKKKGKVGRKGKKNNFNDFDVEIEVCSKFSTRIKSKGKIHKTKQNKTKQNKIMKEKIHKRRLLKILKINEEFLRKEKQRLFKDMDNFIIEKQFYHSNSMIVVMIFHHQYYKFAMLTLIMIRVISFSKNINFDLDLDSRVTIVGPNDIVTFTSLKIISWPS